jgi:hypothetical protein
MFLNVVTDMVFATQRLRLLRFDRRSITLTRAQEPGPLRGATSEGYSTL